MQPPRDDSAELFVPEAGPFLQSPGTLRCIAGCVGIGAILLATAFFVQQTMLAEDGAVGFSPWSIVVLFTGFLAVNLFGWLCFFPNEVRTVRQAIDNMLLNVVVLVATLLIIGIVAASFEGVKRVIPSGNMLTFAVFVWTGCTSAVWFARLHFRSNLTAEQSKALNANAKSFAAYALAALAYLLYRSFV